MRKKLRAILPFLFLAGCAGSQRSCADNMARTYGANWLIAQTSADGTVARCWKVQGQAVDNEKHADGIMWLDPNTGHLVHVSGWISRVMVSGGDWQGLARSSVLTTRRSASERDEA